jgi:hypothetical protein
LRIIGKCNCPNRRFWRPRGPPARGCCVLQWNGDIVEDGQGTRRPVRAGEIRPADTEDARHPGRVIIGGKRGHSLYLCAPRTFDITGI